LQEKDSDPDYDDSDFVDIDTFFVLEQVLEIQEMFREIEGRLQGSWDLNIKALKQYKEREGDCLIPQKHVEVVDGVNVSVGQWVQNIRSAAKGRDIYLLTKERIEQLENLGFIWDVSRYRFEDNVSAIAEYYKENGKYPPLDSKDFKTRALGKFLMRQIEQIRNENFPVWKQEIIKRYQLNLSCEYRADKLFNRFIHFAKKYKEKYGHLNICTKDVIDGYNIGMIYSSMKRKKNTLSREKRRKLKEMGIIFEDKNEILFYKKINLAKEAIKNGIVISSKNQVYEQINLYEWINSTIKRKYKNNELSNEEKLIIEQLIGKPLIKFFNYNRNFVKMVDVIESKEIGIYQSASQITRTMQEDFNMKVGESVVYDRVTGKVTTPYKGRFMFYSATDEEIKKYFEDDKAS